MVPHLVKWDRELRSKGLVVLEVDNGDIDPSIDAVRAHAEKLKVTFPVLWDKDGRTCKAYQSDLFPKAFLIGTAGEILWQGIPDETDPEPLRARILEALQKVDLAALQKNPDSYVHRPLKVLAAVASEPDASTDGGTNGRLSRWAVRGGVIAVLLALLAFRRRRRAPPSS